MKLRIVFVLLLTALGRLHGVCQEPRANFSGTWKLSSERSTPKRGGNVTLRIEHHNPELTIETTIVRANGAPKHAVQHYRTDGTVSVTTGADGDEFHTSIVWKDQTLIFSIEEHEDGRVLVSKEEWTLTENGTALQRIRDGVREPSNVKEKQTLIYMKEAP